MGRAFRTERGKVRVGLGRDERALVAQLLGQVAEMLHGGSDGTDGTDRPADALAESLGLDPQDFSDLAGLTDADLAELTDPQSAGPRSAGPADRDPGDPAMARLLPQAHREDPALAAEFRRLTEHGLRGRKRSALVTAQRALLRDEPVLLGRDEAQALVKGLTDVRLVLGERLGLRTDDDADLIQALVRRGHGRGDDADEENPWVAAALLYDVLTWWQESLVSALQPGRNPPPSRG